MSRLVVDETLCIGCGRCVRACGSAGIVVEGPRGARLARPTDSCILCASCVDACPVDAISIERDEAAGAAEDLASWQGIWVFCQVTEDGAPLPVAFELLGRARELARTRGCEVMALLGTSAASAGEDGAQKAAESLASCGADEVLLCADERLAPHATEVYARWIAGLAYDRRPEVILYGATAFGRELAPAVAVRLKTGLTADCTVLDMDATTGLLQQTRPAFGGNLMATIVCPAHRPQMATVRPGIFAAPKPDPARKGAITKVTLGDVLASRVRVLGLERNDAADTITDTDVLVVVGRGIGSKKALPLMSRLAELLGGKLGCTRPVVEAGWLPQWRQVGQTGVSVAPKLLISVGASGAIQHVAGISGAQTVIAINEDPAAPIFDNATYRVVGDAAEVVGELVSRLEEQGK